MHKKLLSTLFFVLAVVSFSMAQTGSIRGTVTDAETGDTVPGANVLLTEIGRGAATNPQGVYEINNVPVGTYTLKVSFVGYQTFKKQVQITANETLQQNVQLQTSSVGLEEVVVTGYGTEQKRELTGSISSVSSEDFETVPTSNATGLLQGRAAGVQISSTSGNPGGGFEVNIRGQGSISAGNDPLYIVDGVQMSFSNLAENTDASPLNAISPSNIESIEVLKDAAAAAIYGSQGANGVVLITTKSGHAGDTQVKASVERGVRTYIQNTNYMDGPQFVEYFVRGAEYTYGMDRSAAETFVQNNILPIYGHSAGTSFDQLPNYDWVDFVTRRGISSNYNVSVSGGNESTTFRVAGNFENTEGQIRQSDLTRYTLNANLQHEVSDKFSVQSKINLAKNEYQGVCQDGFYINCPLSSATFNAPITKPYNDDGSYNEQLPFGLISNPAVVFNEQIVESNTVQILGNLRATYDFKPWLSLRTQAGLDYRNTRDYDYSNPVASPSEGGTLNEGYNQTTNFTANAVLNFNKSFSEVHNVSGLLGAEYRRDFTRELDASAQGFPNKLFKVMDAAAEPTFTSSFTEEFRVAGYFTNLKYNYDQRYFVSLTARYDGSSRFGDEKRWGFFPSASAGWMISEEDFFNADWVNTLKLRASYGIVGNSQIGKYAARGLYGVSGSYGGVSSLAPTQLANPLLTWEESREVNLGLDYGFFNNRLNGSINVYQSNNQQLLLDTPLPVDSGYGSITRNVGEVRNQGVEFELNSVNVSAGDFLWSSRFNISVAKNTVMELSGNQEMLDPGTTTPVAVGHSLQAYNIPLFAGVNPADGRPMWYDKNGDITYQPGNADRQWYDGGEEDVVGGFGNTFNYKGLSLDVFFQYSFGKTAVPQQVFYFGQAQIGSSFTNGIEEALTESWQQPGDVVGIPHPQIGPTTYPGTDFYSQASSQAFFDASYIRLKNVGLSYSLPSSITNQAGLDNVRIYARGLNLYTWTSYIGFDPEAAAAFTAASYPVARQINAGIEVRF